MIAEYIPNPDTGAREAIVRALKENGGYCPCAIDKTPDTKCPCKDFRNGDGCQCGLYVKK